MSVPGTLTSLLRRKRAHHSFGQRWLIRGGSIFVGLGTLCSGTSSSLAQITSDGSVNSQVYDNPLDFIFHLPNCTIIPNCTAIRGGQLEGDNLFHSFSQFTINAGENVYLGVPPLSILPTFFPNVENIFIRVTGPNAAGIDGNLSVSQNFVRSPNVFFLSPQGIDIGHNARLAYPSNVFFSTAEKLDFGGGAIFDAKTVNLLTLSNFGNLPVALQMGDSAGPINFSNSNPFSRESIDLPKTRHQFTVVGDKINFDNVEISTPGDLNLLSVNDNQTVSLSPSTSEIIFPARRTILRDDVELTNSLILATSLSSLDDAGNIKVFGEDLRLRENSEINTTTLLQGGNIELGADVHVRLYDASKISTQASTMSGVAGKILIDGFGDLELFDNSQISSSTAGSGGNIELHSRGARLQNGSRIFTQSIAATADAGNIDISADSLNIVEQSRIETNSNAGGGEIDLAITGDVSLGILGTPGTAGYISTSSGSAVVSDSDINLTAGGQLVLNSQSQITSRATTSAASAGNVEIGASNVRLLDQNEISTQTHSGGGEVHLTITGGEVQVDNSSRISTAALDGSAIAGNITLNADSLAIQNSSEIASGLNGFTSGNIDIGLTGDLNIENDGRVATFGIGISNFIAGDITIDAGEDINIDGQNSEILSLTESGGGNISLTSNSDINLSDQAQISALFQDGNGDGLQGSSGNIEVRAVDLTLNGDSGILTATAAGQGNIDLKLTGDLSVLGLGGLGEESEILAKLYASTGTAGNIDISANEVLFSNGLLLSETDQPGGNIEVNATGSIRFEQKSVIEPSSSSGAGHVGNLRFTSQSAGISLIDSSLRHQATNTGGNVTFETPGEVELQNGSSILINSSGTGGNLMVSASAFRSNGIGENNDVLLEQGTLTNLLLPEDVTGFDLFATQVILTNANSELLPAPLFAPAQSNPPALPTPPTPPSLALPVIDSPPINHSIVEPLETPTSTPPPPETDNNAPPTYSAFKYLSSQAENVLALERMLQFYGPASSSNGAKAWGCSRVGASYWKITGRGGIRRIPSSLSGSSTALADLGQLDGDMGSSTVAYSSTLAAQFSIPDQSLLEAEAWQKDQQGRINLIAPSNSALAQPSSHRCQSLH